MHVDGGEVWRADLNEAVVLAHGVVCVEDVECGDEGAAIAGVDDANGVGESEGCFGEAGPRVEVVTGGMLVMGWCAHHGGDLVVEFEEGGVAIYRREVVVLWDEEVEARVFMWGAFLVAGVVLLGVGFVLGVKGFKVSLGGIVFFGGGEDVEVKVVVVCGALRGAMS